MPVSETDHRSEEQEVFSPTVSETRMTDEAQRSLKERPSFSIRFRITIAFFLCFILIAFSSLASLFILSQVKKKLSFLKIANDYTFEIQEARRQEKNFFLYSTHPQNALDHVERARNLLEMESEEIETILGPGGFHKMKQSLEQYEKTFMELLRLHEEDVNRESKQMKEIGIYLRENGVDMMAVARDMAKKERRSVDKMLHVSSQIPIALLVIMLILMIYITNFLAMQILRPLSRFVKYTRRIADGDFSPIQPARKYRDEFSKLAVAINMMLNQVKQKQAQFLQSGKMAAVGNLTSGIAHELNNPLNNISLTAESLLDDGEGFSPEQTEMLQDITTQTERASTTVRNLLDFTRSEEPSFVLLQVHEILHSTLKLAQNEIKLNNVQLETMIREDLPMVRGDFSQLQQVFLNLILNGIQAMRQGGVMSISAATHNTGNVRIDVTDTGIGIPQSIIQQIFDPFFTTKEVGKGTGLGLTVSYGIIRKHGGKIEVQSRVNQGTTFSVYLPLGQET